MGNLVNFPKNGRPPSAAEILRNVANSDKIVIGTRVGPNFELYIGTDFTRAELDMVQDLFNHQCEIIRGLLPEIKNPTS